jgi:hypothetical protein
MYRSAAKRCRKRRRPCPRSESPGWLVTILIAPVSQKDTGAAELKAEAAKIVPWFIAQFRGPGSSVCKGHWLEIRHNAKICYARWEDVGPFYTDSAGYVFGEDRPSPNVNRGAGIDVSPAVRDYLGLRSLDLVDLRFVEQADVPAGPWLLARPAFSRPEIRNFSM